MKLKTSKRTNSAVILIISGVIAKILAALYRFPYQNLVGDLGFYAYQQVYPLMSIITTLSLTALPNFLAKNAQEAEDQHYFYIVYFQLSTLLSAVALIIMFCLSRPIALLMGEIQLTPVIMAGSLSLLCLPSLSFIRGYYQAQHELTITAKSQFFEQLVRVFVIWCAAILFIKINLDVYQTATIAMLGSFIGSCMAFFANRGKLPFKLWETRIPLKELKQAFFSFFKSCINFIYFAIYLLIFQLIESFTIKNTLVFSGMTNLTAQVEKGIFDRGQPFVQLGLTVTLALLTQALPRLTLIYRHTPEKYNEIFQKKVKMITIESMAITFGMLSIIDIMNQALFKDNVGIMALSIYVFAIAILSLIQTFHYHFEITNQHKLNSRFLSFGLLSKLLLCIPLTYFFGIVGSSLSTIISLLIVLLCYYIKVKKMFYFDIKLIISLLIMFLTILVFKSLIEWQSRGLLFLKAIILAIIGATVLIILLIKLKVTSFDEFKENIR